MKLATALEAIGYSGNSVAKRKKAFGVILEQGSPNNIAWAYWNDPEVAAKFIGETIDAVYPRIYEVEARVADRFLRLTIAYAATYKVEAVKRATQCLIAQDDWLDMVYNMSYDDTNPYLPLFEAAEMPEQVEIVKQEMKKIKETGFMGQYKYEGSLPTSLTHLIGKQD